MLVRIVKDWPYPETFFGQTPKENGVWGKIKFTEEPVDACDYLIVLQRPPYTISVNCPEGNAWLITQEPPVDYFRFLTRSFRYFDRVYSFYNDVRHPSLKSMQPVLPWHLLKSYTFLTSLGLNDLSNKNDDLVWITSNKTGFPGQKARMRFRQYLQRSKIRHEIYGRGFKPIHDKFDGIFPCKYALAIENYSVNNYWTEKIADCWLSWSLPFYWGAGNLESFFPPGSFIRVDIEKPDQVIEIIHQAIQNNEWEKRLGAIAKARDLILNEYQFFPYMAKMIQDDLSVCKEKKIKKYIIPKNPYPWQYKVSNQFKYYGKRLTDLF
jgi:hypothetical protein